MPDDHSRGEPLAASLQARFGEAFEIPKELDGLDQLARMAAHRTYRRYRSEPIDAALVRLLAAVALSAPSKSDLQQADIIQVADPKRQNAIAALVPTMPWVAEAPVFLVFCGNGRRLPQASELRGERFANNHLDHFFNAAVDAALVLQNFITASEAVGLGCCPISVIRNHAAKVSELLALPDHVFPVAGLCVGWPDQERHISARLPLSQTLHQDRHDDSALARDLDGYDRRRGLAEGYDPEASDFVGWSTAKARTYAESQREDFGRFVQGKGFRLV